MKILGIDPGSRIVGYACIVPKTLRPLRVSDFHVLDVGVIRADITGTFLHRIGALHEALFTLTQEHAPTLCVLETAFMGKNAQSALKLGQARGALIAAMSRCGVPMAELSPREVKQFITGKGHADKQSVRSMLEKLVQFQAGGLPLDATDALALALGYAAQHVLGRAALTLSS